MKCAICKKDLGDKHYIIDIHDLATDEYHVLHCCGRCSWNLAGLWRGSRLRMAWHVQNDREPVATTPLRVIEKAQVNGLL